MKLRYSEAFYSVQGEGKFVGVPSVFLRTFGCNFRCMNFGVDKSVGDRWKQHAEGNRYNAEVKALLDDGIVEKTEKLEDLPLANPSRSGAKKPELASEQQGTLDL